MKNNLGYAANPNNVRKVLTDIIKDYKSGNLKYESNFEIDQYSVKKLTDKLIACFQ